MCAVIDKDSLTIEEQYQYLSAIPNYHKWVWVCEKDRGLMVEQRFSSLCSRYPGSQRNRIVQVIAFWMDCHLILFLIVKHLLRYKCEIPYKAVKEMNSKRKNAFKRKQKTFSWFKKGYYNGKYQRYNRSSSRFDHCDSLLHIFITERKLSNKIEDFDSLEFNNFEMM